MKKRIVSLLLSVCMAAVLLPGAVQGQELQAAPQADTGAAALAAQPDSAVVQPDSAAAPSSSETAPSIGETAPSIGETAPSGSAAAPSIGETAPSGSETAPSIGETAPSGSETAPSTGEAAPPTGEGRGIFASRAGGPTPLASPINLDLSTGSIKILGGSNPGTLKIEQTGQSDQDNIPTGTPLVITQTVSGTTQNTITVNTPTNVTANITLAGVNIDASSTDYAAAFEIKDAAGPVTLTLQDRSVNTLQSGMDAAELEKEASAALLTLRCAQTGAAGHTCTAGTCGELNATGYGSAAGIGGSSTGFAPSFNRTGSTGNITISGGIVKATGGDFGAGIGGGGGIGSSGNANGGNASNITISGGIVTATGGDYGAGIGGGGGNQGRGGDATGITISGGSVIATGGNTGVGASNGASGWGSASNITISGGSVTATATRVPGGVGIGGGGAVSNVFLQPAAGRLLAAKAGADASTATDLPGSPFSAPSGDISSVLGAHNYFNSEEGAPPLLLVSGGTPGTDYTYDTINGVVTILTAKDMTIENADITQAITHRIVVATPTNVTANLTLAGVNIVNNTSDTPAFWIKDTAGPVMLTLQDGSVNTLKSGRYAAGLQKGDTAAWLTICCAQASVPGHDCTASGSPCGVLNATGGDWGAGIGGFGTTTSRYGGSTSHITISGGIVTAIGGAGSGRGGSGIGGGNSGDSDSIGGDASHITISGGSVTATGGGGAGIGGSNGATTGGNASDIAISGGSVTATGGAYAAGIGGGSSTISAAGGTANNIAISGGIVTATGAAYAAGIGGGSGNNSNGTASNITISGGSVTATGGANGMGIGGGSSTTSIFIDPAAGQKIAAKVGADATGATVLNGSPFAQRSRDLSGDLAGKLYFHSEPLPPPLTVLGGVSGTDYTYDIPTGVVTILTATPMTIRNTDPDLTQATDHRIVVKPTNASTPANITLAGVNIETTANNTPAFAIDDTAAGAVTLTLQNGSVNTLKSGGNAAGLQKGATTALLTIRCEQAGAAGHDCTVSGSPCGVLNATGGAGSAGIGGIGSGGSTSNITISGGIVTATGGVQSAGIGGSHGNPFGGAASNITISGGIVTATGGGNGPGIGGSHGNPFGGAASNITISGGSVTAIGNGYVAGIGGGMGQGSTDDGTPSNIFLAPAAGQQIAAKAGANASNAVFHPNSPLTARTDITTWTTGNAYFHSKAEHSHAWAGTWGANATHHWHECTIPGCTLSQNSQKNGYAPHAYASAEAAACTICGQTRSVSQPPKGPGKTIPQTGDTNHVPLLLTAVLAFSCLYGIGLLKRKNRKRQASAPNV